MTDPDNNRQRAGDITGDRSHLLDALINTKTDLVIFSLDRNYCYTTFNEKHRLEMRAVWHADIKIGGSLLEYMTDRELRELAKESIDRALSGENFTEIRYQLGVNIYYEFIWGPIRRSDGAIDGVTAFIHDITARKLAEAKIERLSRLYATLSQCNQAIMRCPNETTLFAQICHDAVTFGGMRMAWVGLVDEASQRVERVAQFGEGSTFFEDLTISASAHDPSGRGPTGTAIREGRPIWCQDYLNDPSTAPWHERGARAGWASSASLPLRRFGVVVGALSLYAAEVNAFDEDVRKLLIQMADDLDFAVDNFARNAGRKAAEQALQTSEQRFRDLVDSTDGMVWEADANTFEFSFVSGNAERLLGYPTTAWLTPGFWASHIHPEDRDVAVQYCVDCSGRSEDHFFEYRFLAQDGREVWLSDMVKVISRDGKPDRLRGLMIDISERKRTEASLQESETRFRHLVDWTAEPFFIHIGGTISYVNPAGVRLLGATSAEALIGTPFLDRVHPEFHQMVQAQMKMILDDGIGPPMTEQKYLKVDGTVIDVEVQGTSIVYDGILAIHTSAHDITERKKTESDLSKLSRAIEQSPVSIVITDRRGNIEYVNPYFEQATGYTKAEAMGNNPRMFKSGKTPAETYEQLWAAIGAGKEWRGELCNRRKNGELYWEFATISGVRNESGKVEYFIAVKEDITARKQADAAQMALEAQLHESQKMQAIGTLAGGIAHDFNNILATILGNVDLARDDANANPRVLESLTEIHKAAARARSLVQQILSFSRRDPVSRKPILLGPVIEESARLLRATLPARVRLEVQCDALVPVVLADANQIEQVVINLATNAMQAMAGRPGRIDIRLDAIALDAAQTLAHPELQAMVAANPGLTVRITVTDDGPGMDADTLARIFEPFFTTKPVGEGTGLGLSVVHGIARLHYGVIVVDSASGAGAIFSLYLPAAAVAADVSMPAPIASVAAEIAALDSGGSRHILYLDDDESLVFLVTRQMERQGYRVSGYIDQQAALDALRAQPAAFDLVITDYNMPGMSGLDVAREVRAIRADLPVAIASGFIDETLHTEAEEAGVRELIFKANAVEELCAAFIRLARLTQAATKHATSP